MLHKIICIDCLQIGFLTVAFYYILEWLSTDQTRNLKIYFLGLCATSMLSWYLQLSGILFFLSLFWPVICVLFFLIHEKQLQKNFITIAPQKSIKKSDVCSPDWIDTLMHVGLYNMTYHKNSLSIIEMKEPLQSLITSAIPLQIPINKRLLEVVSQSFKEDTTVTFWYTNSGIVNGIDLALRYTDEAILNNQMDHNERVETVGSLIQATDAIALYADHQSHTWTLYHGQSVFQQLTARATQQMLSKIIYPGKQKGDLHVQKHQNNLFKQTEQ